MAGLFSRKSVEPVVSTPPVVETPPAAPQINIDYDIIVNRVTDNLKPLFGRQQIREQQNDPEPEPEDDISPEERARTERMVDRRVRDVITPYQNTFDRTMPTLARREALENLTDGEKIIINRHAKEVEGYVAEATAGNPAARGNSELWRRAMKLTVSEHIEEVQRMSHENISAEDLPPQFAPPTGGPAKTRPEDTLTDFEQHSMNYYNSQRKNNNWTPEEYKYYQNIKPGTLEQMVAQHKAQQKKD